MKTLLATAFLALAIGACSSDASPSLVTNSLGTVPQGGTCSSTADCDKPLTCAFQLNAGGACKTTGTCVAMGPCSYQNVCPCGGGAAVSACLSETFSTVSIASGTCAGGTGTTTDGGTTTATDASTGGSTTGG